MYIQFLLLILGIAVIYGGGELFIRGSAGTARLLGIKPLIVGLVVAAFATSSPEFCVSLLAALKNNSNIAIGNILGSCICNIGLVLGISALIKPISVNVSILRRELPMLFAATLIFGFICLDFRITRIEGLVLLLCFALFVFYCVRNAKSTNNKNFPVITGEKQPRRVILGYLALGLSGLLIGAHIMVSSSVNIARMLNISEFVLGLTVVAIGTSLPELATSAVASWRGEGDISIGNVIGSNIFNILAIVGVVSLITPITINPGVTLMSMPLLIIYTVALAPILKSGLKISRIEGVFLLISYIFYIYIIYLK